MVKAFDSVDRALMLDIIRRYGVPEHLVSLIHLLHTDVTVRLAVGKVEAASCQLRRPRPPGA
jgi:hypothetical protein